MTAIDWSSRNSLVATAREDLTIRVQDAETGQVKFVLEGHQDVVSSLAFSHDGRQLASASFDLVISINVLHNLYAYELDAALREMERVGRRHRYICVESWRNEEEKANLLYWQLTCETFCTPEEWAWWFRQTGYSGDHSFIFFE